MNLLGTATATTNINDTGTAGSDVLGIIGTAVADTFTIATNQVRLGNETVNTNATIENANVNAAGGDDIFAFSNGGSINGTLEGGTGSDILNYSAYTTPVTANLAQGTATGTGAIANIENVTGGTSNDTLIGDANNNQLRGNGGDDTLTGNAGTDLFDGGAGSDRVVETRDANIALTDTTLTIGAEGTDTLNSIEAATLTGGATTNTLTSNFSGTATLDATPTLPTCVAPGAARRMSVTLAPQAAIP